MSPIVVTGGGGQVGWELRRALLPLGQVIAPARADFDLLDGNGMRQRLRQWRPSAIVNAAAYTAVDAAQTDRDTAFAINAEAPRVLAEEAARLGSLLVHYSTDYVFDGGKAGAYAEDDTPRPLNIYGASKLAGEQAVAASGADHLILRTSWVYGGRGKNFLLTMLRLAQERAELRVVDDQHGAPTWSRFLAEATAAILLQATAERQAERFASGLFHLVCAGETTWHGFACAAIRRAHPLTGAPRFANERVVPIATSDYPTAAQRPRNSRLATGRVAERFGIAVPEWDDCLQLCLEDLYGPA